LLEQSNSADQIVVQLQNLNLYYENQHENFRNFVAAKSQGRNGQVELRILESFRFPSMGDREAAVAEAHQETFEWIFKDLTATSERSWSNFSEWLKTGTDIYWIQGKAGSGKSTLVRFIMAHPKTREYLSSWSQNGTADAVTFFFWKGDMSEQRSLVGLLRSLLWEALSNRTERIPHGFPEDWNRLYTLQENDLPLILDTWTIKRLQNAFRNLVKQANEHSKFCFSIDDLDELEGDQSDHAGIVRFIESFSALSFVKFCVSSRPWPVFSQFFEKYSGLNCRT
jgi:hypothetical protein